jgi:hypothetical protein
MATSSLSKMSVPISGASSNQGLLMPKLKYRFRVFFDNFGAPGEPPTTELTKQVISFTRPNPTFEEISLPIYNSTLKLAGKHSWPDVTCEVRDDAGGNISKLIGGQLQKQMDFIEQASAAAGIDYKFTTRVQILDGNNGTAGPTVLETWELLGCYIKNADYGSLNYGESAPVTVNMTITYDNANQLTGDDASVFANQIGRTIGGAVSGVGSA